MHTRVTALLVARNGAQFLGRTTAALVAQTRRPDALVAINAGSTDESVDLLAEVGPTQFVETRGSVSLGGAIAESIAAIGPAGGDDEWLWLLTHDNAPEPTALAALLAAVEVAPSVAVAGPKLMRWDEPATIAAFGESLTPFGASVQLVRDELDQAQHDRQNDLLAVAASGMLVRRTLWAALGGFDPGLPSVDAALDFCVRARRAGHRVIAVPDARVASVGGPEDFGREKLSAASRFTTQRAAQLHRRLVYAPAAAVPLHWLSLVPLALGRAIVQLAAKRPWAVGPEIVAAFTAAFDTRIGAARRVLAAQSSLGWKAIAPLRVQHALAREIAANRAERAASVEVSSGIPERARPSFITAGGAWIVLLLLAGGVISSIPYLGAAALTGGGLLPLSGTIAAVWSQVGVASDPFTAVLAVLASLTFWSPSTVVVVLWILALPLAGLAAWVCAARLSSRGWAPAIAALLWALSPTLLVSLRDGHIAAVLAHLLLPWLVLAILGTVRSLSAVGAGAILFAAVAACAPVLVPALLVAWVAWLATHPRSIVRLLFIPVPAAVLFAPLVVAESARGNWLALLAEPGVPLGGLTPTGWQLTVGSAAGDANGWAPILQAMGLNTSIAGIVVAALLVPLAALAVLALFLPGSRRAVPALGVALLGFIAAVASSHIAVSHVGSNAVAIWAGPALSLYWLGLVGAVVMALEALAASAALPGILTALGAAALAVPLLAAPLAGGAALVSSQGRTLPAFVTAEATTSPSIGTLELRALPDGAMSASVQRGAGTTLDALSTRAQSSTELSDEQQQIAVLAANLAAPSGLDIAPVLEQYGIGFILLPDVADDSPAAVTYLRASDALDDNEQLQSIGATAFGHLWLYSGDVTAPQTEKNSWTDPFLIALAVAFGLALVLAIPTGVRRRPVNRELHDENPADTFEEDESV